MKFLTPGIRLTLLLLLMCSLLGGMLVQEWRNAQQSTSSATIQPDSTLTIETELVMPTYTPPTLAAFGGILERPLFTPGREPPPEPEPVAAAVVMATPLRLNLEGVAVSTEARVAVVRDLSSNKLLRIVEGDKHEGWTLERVHPAGATFSQGDETRELTLVPDETTPGPR